MPEPGTAEATSRRREEPPKPREYGLALATFVVISSMVGVGVLTTSGYTVAAVGSNQLMLWLWLLGGVVALCGAMTVAELAARMPASGGDYVYLLEAYGPAVAFLSGWVSFLIGFAAPIAVAAFAAATYLLAPLELDSDDGPGRPPGAGDGGDRRVWPDSRLGPAWHDLGAFGDHGVQSRRPGHAGGGRSGGGLARGGNLADRPPLDFHVVSAMMFSLVYISYGYTGWNAASYLGGEIGDPGRRLPRSILIGTASVIVLYLGLNLVYALALPAGEIQEIAKRDGFEAVAPIAELAAQRLFGPALAAPLSIAIGLTLLASLSAYVLTGPRVAYAMARAGHFPAIAGRLTTRSRTPAIATALQVAWALVLLWTGSFESIVIYAGVGLALFSMLTVSSIYVLRWTRPDLPRPFRTPGYPVVPAIFLTVTTILTIAAFVERPRVSIYSLLSILAGIPVYYFWLRPGRRASL